jgi:hypothetical protein
VGLTLESFRPNCCCLCGSVNELTGEHKIKAAALRAEFGSDRLVIGSSSRPDLMRSAQGVKSKEFHFQTPLCATCNNERTQAADREFDRFHARARSLLSAGHDPEGVFDDPRYATETEEYINVFRYFAKLLCCHVADMKGPRRRHVASFALGQETRNCVWLQVKEDWTYQQLTAELGTQQYAAHGGLVIYGDKLDGSPTAFHSTLTLGPIQYVFHSRLTWLELLELQADHINFYELCRAKVHEAAHDPMSETERQQLGLSE